MQEIITLSDYLLLPVYLLVFYFIARRKAKKYQVVGLKKYFLIAFWLRMAGAILYGMLIQYYYGYGDSFGYYQGGNVISGMIQQDFTSVKYLFYPAKDVIAAATSMGFADNIPVTMPNDSNISIMKLSAIISFFTFNKYLLISITCGFFSFVGIWKLFYVFYQLNNKKQVKLLAFFVLFFPSLWFWGSGLLKEPVCVGSLGMVIYLFYKNFIQKKFSLLDVFFCLIFLGVLSIVKVYITVILIISLVTALIYQAIIKIKSIIFRTAAVFLILFSLGLAFASLDVSSYIESFVQDSYNQIQLLQNSYKSIEDVEEVGSKGTFSITDINPSFESILANSPAVIGSCLFRPFVWESRKIIIFFASLEALLTLLITLFILYKTKVWRFFKYVFSDGFLLFSFIFSILFALVVGYTTYNFGTLIRYKIIFLPFYYYLVINIYTKKKDQQKTRRAVRISI